MQHIPTRPRALQLLVRLALITALAASTVPYRAAAAATTSAAGGPRPTIVLVHGAWADASGWSAVIERLQRNGLTVLAPANPLRGLPTDSEYLASVLASLPGPIVLVGHSYGGMVMTNAAAANPNVAALVYIAAFAPDVGETVGGLGAMNPGSELDPTTLIFRPHPAGLDVYIDPAAYRRVFAEDLPARMAAVLAASQRPIDASALGQPSGPPSWSTIPSWYLVARQDRAIPPATQRFMADRAGATTTEVRSSHAAMISRPGAVSDVILAAVQASS